MGHLNVEIKARCTDLAAARAVLEQLGADCRGVDEQTDTFFPVPHGRLKLRQGNIETALIHYDRPDQPGPKDADVQLHHPADPGTLRETLARALGVQCVVRKRREIWFAGNVKIHLDTVEPLGTFLEIEAIDTDGSLGRDHLLTQCRRFMDLLDVRQDNLVDRAYADLLAECDEG